MSIIVQKFGGTSVASVEHIRKVAELIIHEKNKGNQVIVVTSAMAGVTDQLIGYIHAISSVCDLGDMQEYDSVLSSGEQISSGLLALALRAQGFKARSWLGWQLPIETGAEFTKARIDYIKTGSLTEALNYDEIPIIAGFQGIYGNRITTLGRGGSDTTAAAIASAMTAERCDIYTDVEGVFTADPKIVDKARKIDRITYEEMLEMASSGAKVLHSRAIEIAMKYNLKLQVLSSFNSVPGTMLVNEEEMMEKQSVTGIACTGDEVSITLEGMEDRAGVAAEVLEPLKKHHINIDMIVQNMSKDGYTDLTFTINKRDLAQTVKFMQPQESVHYKKLIIDDNIAKISVIGIGMKTNSGVAQKMFQILADKGINILVISTSEIKISVLVRAEYKELAVRALHTGYNLDI